MPASFVYFFIMYMKINLFVLFIVLSKMVFAQDTGNVKSGFGQGNNMFKFGLYACNNGYGNIFSVMYLSGYGRKINRYLDAEFNLGFTNSIYGISTLADYPEESYNTSSIVTMDFVGNLRIVDARRHLLRFGIGYSLEHVKANRLKETYYFYEEELKKYIAVVNAEKLNGFSSSFLLQFEYGFRVTPKFMASVSGKHYSETKDYITLTIIGINFYYSF